MKAHFGRGTRNILSILFLALGIGLLAYPLVTYGVGCYNQRKLRQQWEQSEKAAQVKSPTAVVEEKKPPPPPKAGEPIAEMSVPDLNMRVIIVEGTSDTILARGPGHFSDSALPGQFGNCCIAGHRNMYGSWFRRVNRLSGGDKIILRRLHTNFEYRVTQRLVVAPSDTSVLKPTSDPTLTLITCTPVPKPTHRLVIVAKMKQSR